MKKNFKKLLILLIVGIIFILTFYWWLVNISISNDKTEVLFVVEKGWGSTKISHELKDQGFIRSALAFQMYTWTNGFSSRLIDGEYNLSSSMSLKEIAQILRGGSAEKKEVNITIIEGWTNADIAKYLETQGFGKADDFMAIVQKKADWWDDYDFLASKPNNIDLEGYLFPDTYRVYRDASLESIVKKMLDNFNIKLSAEIRGDIKKQGKTIHEIITLASVIEKEVRTAEERKMVADIFYKRLDIGMALQSDATVNYVTGRGVARASAQDLQVESLYNTYKYRGLPPGPISHPALSAILAAVYPTKNDYWYFLTTPSGEVVYSETFEEHVRAKNLHYPN